MLHCKPRWFSAKYDISGDGRSAIATFSTFGEWGQIETERLSYEIQKQGILSGRWSMMCGGEEIAMALKENAFTRSIFISTPVGPLTLKARSIFGRSMLLTGSGYDAVIAPIHMFSRQFSIIGNIPNFEISCFVFWLTAMLRRRQNSSSSP